MPSCPPGFVRYQLKQGDTLYRLAQSYSTTVHDIRNANPGIDPDYLRVGQIICVPKKPSARMAAGSARQMAVGFPELELRNTWRTLWEQHVAWTRMTILSDVFGLPDLSFTAGRLLRNPQDMALVMRRFYGDFAANTFKELMTNHLLIAIDLVNAAKAGNAAAASEAEKRWYANADDIAYFLAHLNPNWPQDAIKTMLYQHLSLTKKEAEAIRKGEYNLSIQLYDRIEQQALEMADAISAGIAKQFT
ncbi:MAG: LysM peptidoglycan-binding domain-containing protein [Bacillota bacterium]